jgi:hypothetical protein
MTKTTTIWLLVIVFCFLRIDFYGRSHHFIQLIDTDSNNLAKRTKVGLDLQFPWANGFNFRPDLRPSTLKNGFIGIGLGINIRIDKRVDLNVFGRSVLDFPVPFPAPVRYVSGEFWFLRTQYLGITNSHTFGIMTLGYGVCFGQNTWNYQFRGSRDTTDKRVPTSIIEKYTISGFLLDIRFKPWNSKAFYFGVTYRPTFFRPKLVNKFQYEHLLSIDFGWRLLLK